MTLPAPARFVISAAVAAGIASLTIAAYAVMAQGGMPRQTWVLTTVFGAFVVASWVWPLVLYRDSESECVHLDEGFFVIMVLVLPAFGTILAFTCALVVAQALRRRALIKSAFNVGQITTSIGLGIAVTRLLAPPTPTLTVAELGAATVGAVVFFIVNSAWLAAIVAATGTGWRSAVVDGIEIRLLLAGAAVTVGLTTALAISAYRWSIALVVVPLVILRQVLAGHFRARHDRTRLRGLFDATLEANRSFGESDVRDTILSSARHLLRCADAQLINGALPPGGLGAPVPVKGHDHLLVVSGRSRTEPFDGADQALLEAIAAVAAGAFTNADLYEQGRHQRERLAAITASLGEGVCALDGQGCITFMNPAAAAMLERAAVGGATGANVVDAPFDLAPSFLLVPARRAMETLQTVRHDDTVFTRRTGASFPVAFTASPITEEGETAGAVLVFRDITERKAFEEQLARHAFHDELTGLANRRLFIDHLDHALRRSERSAEVHAVLFADVDRFKVINDSLGHHAGDELLVAIAARIGAAVRPGDVLARFGGDEFTVLLEAIDDVGDAVTVADRISDRMREPIVLSDGHEIVATVSVGVALSADGKSRDDVLHDADVAMYQAKAKGRTGRCEIFDVSAMGARSAERLELESGLRRALERGELEVYYQPLQSIAKGVMIGAEALVRWNHPERGLVGPGEFIGLAEENGLILPIGSFVLVQACRRARHWKDRFGVALSMSVNLSARQFQQRDLVEHIKSTLDEAGLDPHQLCLEITESLAMEDVDRTTLVLAQLKSIGVRLAIDDFGTGYSSLSYLKRFPVDVVKIDRSFVEGLEDSRADSAIVAAVIGLADTLDMVTVAEGVETLTQLEHLRRLGCGVAQGFYFSRPVPSDQIERFIASSYPPVMAAAERFGVSTEGDMDCDVGRDAGSDTASAHRDLSLPQRA